MCFVMKELLAPLMIHEVALVTSLQFWIPRCSSGVLSAISCILNSLPLERGMY